LVAGYGHNLRLSQDAHITGETPKTRNLGRVPWNSDQGGGQPKGPWGQSPNPEPKPGPRPSGGVRPPDIETLLKKFWSDVRRYVPPGMLGRRGAWTLVTLIVAIWLALGFYTVNSQEQGVVLRFGAFVKHTGPGTYYHLPWPIETAYTPNVNKINTVDVGFRPAAEANRPREDVQAESYMLTGDESVIDMQFTVNWRIKDANTFLFNNADYGAHADDTVKAVAESAMREVVGQDRLNQIMTSHREEIQIKVRQVMQAMLDSYNAGIEVIGVKMQAAETPSQVSTAYLDVQRALADQDRVRSDAEAYQRRIVPQARGEAVRIVEEAQGYRTTAITEANGEAQRFAAVLAEYRRAPEVTRRRLYLETMTQVLGPMNKIIIDDSARTLLPSLQLPPLPGAHPAAPSPPHQPSAAVSEGAQHGAGK
jgi:modulator of FtsH protease HflK